VVRCRRHRQTAMRMAVAQCITATLVTGLS
jgi:hypothetical protein